MERSGLTQDEAADRIGVDQTTLQRWLKGTRLPAAPQIEKVCRAFGVSGHFLLTGEGPEYAPGKGSGSELAIGAVKEDLRRKVLSAVEAALADPAPTVESPDELSAKTSLMSDFAQVKRGAAGTAAHGKGKRRQGEKG